MLLTKVCGSVFLRRKTRRMIIAKLLPIYWRFIRQLAFLSQMQQHNGRVSPYAHLDAQNLEDYARRFLTEHPLPSHTQAEKGGDTADSDARLKFIVESRFPGAREMRIDLELSRLAEE